MNQTKKSSFKAFDINQMMKEELYKSKFIKTALLLGGVVVGLFALGFVFKAVNYTAHNLKNLSATLKR